ncbi:tetratricopeptide repeat protein [Lysobacter solisilvae (ex Woo and Kim 2020)]|uniref:Tetratricopeptide repeat protein n=1 Tax=Agrilutibacter terrestris TaxID=2865112 RepID=A0A7H0FUE3_9GAMM|nr:putative 2OG-Fe(II) oxygenase [Lysobacter terrestris]QNP39659.1 tetratricopeptide repeat protein [Lysobacter terrestris]
MPQQLNAVIGLLRSGVIGEALPLAQQLVARAPQDAEARQLLALCLARSGSAADAEREFVQALQLAPAHPGILANLAVLLRGQGRVQEAIPLWRRALAVQPKFVQAWIDLGAAELSLGQHQAATVAFEQALALQPSALAWHYLGNARRDAGDLPAAETAFRNAVALDPRSASAWINLGAVLRLLGRADETIACYERAEALGYPGADLRDALVGALIDAGRIADALRHARRLVAEQPGFAPGHRTLAGVLWEYGPPLQAPEDPFALFAAAADAQPENLVLQSAHVAFLIEARRSDEALARLQALRRRADSALLVRMHADALDRSGQSGEAAPLYSRLYADGDRSAAFLNAYSRHLLVIGDATAAAARASDVLQQDPWNQQALAYLATAWRLLGDEREFWLCDYGRLVQAIDVEVPPGFGDRDEFLVALAATLDTLHLAAREPLPESVRGGSQTPGQLFGRRDPVIESTRQALQQAAGRWLAQLPADPAHPFLQRNVGRTRFAGSWSVKLWQAGRHANHIHSQGWISSAFYVQLPPSMRDAADGAEAGCIQFGQPPQELGLPLPPRRVIRPQPGKLVLFPSYLWHGTVPFDDSEPRVTVAFDLVPLPPAR